MSKPSDMQDRDLILLNTLQKVRKKSCCRHKSVKEFKDKRACLEENYLYTPSTKQKQTRIVLLLQAVHRNAFKLDQIQIKASVPAKGF